MRPILKSRPYWKCTICLNSGHCWFCSLVKSMTKSEAVNDQQVWCYLTLKMADRAWILVPRLDIDKHNTVRHFGTYTFFFQPRRTLNKIRASKHRTSFEISEPGKCSYLLDYFSSFHSLEYFRTSQDLRSWNIFVQEWLDLGMYMDLLPDR